MEHLAGVDVVRSLGSLLTVWAHPDDESYLAAGLMATASGLGAPVTCVTATLGERGGPVDQQAETAWRRSEELSEALRALGVTDSIVLGHGDGSCAGMPPREPVQAIVTLLNERRPDTVVTFGPDGLTGHPDHQAVSRWVSAAVLLADGPPPRLLHATETIEHAARVPDLEGIYAPGLPRRHALGDVALSLALQGEILERKIAALRAHRSQTAALERTVGGAAYRRWASQESFIDAPSVLGRLVDRDSA